MKKYAKELDVYSGIAIIFVVLIHANAFYLLDVLGLSDYYQAGYFITTIDKIIHVAVPMFIFISGYKYQLGNKNINYRKFLKKRSLPLIVPFAIISLFYILVNISSHLIQGEISLLQGIKVLVIDIFKAILGYNIAYPLWFVPMFLFVILAYPIIRKVVVNQKKRFVIFSLLSIVYVIANHYFGIFGAYNKPFNFVYYFLFFEIGCFIADKNLNKNQQLKIIVGYLSLLIASIILASTVYDKIVTDLLLTPLAVIAFYYFSLYLKENKIILLLGSYSFYIFLLHEPVFVKGISGILLENGLYNGYYITIIITLIAIFLSIVVYKILNVVGLSRFIFYEKRKSTSKDVNIKINA